MLSFSLRGCVYACLHQYQAFVEHIHQKDKMSVRVFVSIGLNESNKEVVDLEKVKLLFHENNSKNYIGWGRKRSFLTVLICLHITIVHVKFFFTVFILIQMPFLTLRIIISTFFWANKNPAYNKAGFLWKSLSSALNKQNIFIRYLFIHWQALWRTSIFCFFKPALNFLFHQR